MQRNREIKNRDIGYNKNGKKRKKKCKTVYSRVDKKTRAKTKLSCMIKKQTSKKVINWKYYNKRILRIDVEITKQDTLNMTIGYSSNQDAKIVQQKTLEEAVDKSIQFMIITGGINERVGTENNIETKL